MVNTALSIGGLVGVALSGGFVYWQVGRFAAPQVPRTLFDERKEFMAYTVGLFAGIPLALALIFYVDALGFGALIAAGIGGILALTIVTQYLSGTSITLPGLLVMLAQAVALLIIQVASGLLSVRSPARVERTGGSPLGGGLFATFGLVVLGLGILIGPTGALFGALIAAAGGVWVYQRLRDSVLGGLLPPRTRSETEAEPLGSGAYRRLPK